MRTIDLPKELISEKVKVSFKNGILEVRLLKTEEARPRKSKSKSI
jgi:HSP20 family molecular chaperone IbpA